MDESQNFQNIDSFDTTISDEHQSNSTDYEASIMKSENSEDSRENYLLDCGPSSGLLEPTTSQQFQPAVRNRRWLPQHAKTYELNTFSKNLMLVFNMCEIPTYEPRHGTEMDVIALKTCFEPRGFDVVVYNDYTRDQIYTTFKELTVKDLSDFGCLAVVFLTLGRDDGILLTKDHPIHESAIINFLTGTNAPCLITKPKILINQAGRGTPLSQAITATDQVQSSSYSHDGEHKYEKPYRMANETDFLRVHSAYPGMVTHGDQNGGSFFIQSLCKFIGASDPDDDILSVIPLVIQDVSINYEHQISNNNSVITVDKQVPIMTTTLSRKLCFNTGRTTLSSILEFCDDVDSTIMHKNGINNETSSDMVKKTMRKQFNVKQRIFPNRSLSNIAVRHEYNTDDFRMRYFEYVRDILDYFVEISEPDNPNTQQARSLLDIAKTIDCSLSLFETREQTCLQMVLFLEKHDFDGKEHMFCYKYM